MIGVVFHVTRDCASLNVAMLALSHSDLDSLIADASKPPRFEIVILKLSGHIRTCMSWPVITEYRNTNKLYRSNITSLIAQPLYSLRTKMKWIILTISRITGYPKPREAFHVEHACEITHWLVHLPHLTRAGIRIKEIKTVSN